MVAGQPPATTAGPRPNGMISAPVPEGDQPLPETFERLSTIVSVQRKSPAITPSSAINPVYRGSRLGSPTDPAIEQHPTESPHPHPPPQTREGEMAMFLADL